jgi:LemA protein
MDYLPLYLFAALIVIFVIVQMYNGFIKYRNLIDEHWSGIDVALKRRHNLIPNLARTVRAYAEYEAATLERVTEERVDRGNVGVREEHESEISRGLNQALAVAEAYPDLKTSNNYLALQEALNEVEQEIQQARSRYNTAVRKYNTHLESFPSNLMARMFKFRKRAYFSLELATQRELPVLELQAAAEAGR